MKKIISIWVLLALGTSSWAALFTRTADGNWSALSQWSDKGSGKFAASTVLPGSKDTVVVNSNKKVTLDTDATVALFQIINTAQNATVDVDGEKTLTTKSIQLGVMGTGAGILNQVAGTISSPATVVGRATGESGVFNVQGGTFDMGGKLTIGGTGVLNVNGGKLSNSFDGAVRTITGSGLLKISSGAIQLKGAQASDAVDLNSALFEVSGGTVDLGAQVRVGNGASSEFRVAGDAAKITFDSLDQATAAKGTFKFVFGANGISTICVKDALQLSNAKIVVDGSAYTGAGGTFTLFNSENLTSPADASNITVTGFGARTANVVQDKTGGKGRVQLVVAP